MAWMVKHADNLHYAKSTGLDPGATGWRVGDVSYAGSWPAKANDSGFHFVAMDVQGHGASESAGGKARCFFNRFDDLALDAFQFLSHTTSLFPGLPIFALGTSMGACILLRAMQFPTAYLQPSIDWLARCPRPALCPTRGFMPETTVPTAANTSRSATTDSEGTVCFALETPVAEAQAPDAPFVEPQTGAPFEDAHEDLEGSGTCPLSEAEVVVTAPPPLPRVEGYIAVGGMFDLDSQRNAHPYKLLGGIVRFASRAVPKMVIVPAAGNEVYPYINTYVNNDPLVYKGGIRARTVEELFAAVDAVKRDRALVTSSADDCPEGMPPTAAAVLLGRSLVVHNKFDGLCDVRGAVELFDGLPLSQKSLWIVNVDEDFDSEEERQKEDPRLLERLPRFPTPPALRKQVDVWHNMVSEPDQGTVFDHILRWIDGRLE